MSKNKNKKGNKKEDIPENFEEEIAKYLAQTEKVVQKQQEADKEILELKQKEQLVLESIKNLSSKEMFTKIVDMINEALIEDENIKKAKKDLEDAKSEISFYYSNMQNLTQQMLELDVHNKKILEQIKIITEEKKKLVTLEEEKTKDIKRQCDDFKTQTKSKYDETSNSIIVKDNEVLQAKLEEVQGTTQKIKENIESQTKAKDPMNFQEMFENQINDKMNDLIKQSSQFSEENEKLKDDAEIARKNYDTLANSMKKFNKKFETSKREFEKSIKDLISLGKESQELRSADIVSIQNEINKNDKVLKELVAKNKDLQNKIKELKEQ